jgi:hypothetical protein
MVYFTQNGLNRHSTSFKEKDNTHDSIKADNFADFCCVSLLIARCRWKKAFHADIAVR